MAGPCSGRGTTSILYLTAAVVNHQVQSISGGSKPPPQLRHACHAQLHGTGAAAAGGGVATRRLPPLLLGELRGLLAISGMLGKPVGSDSAEWQTLLFKSLF